MASVRGILHNPFYKGQVKHKGQLHTGVNKPLISANIFDTDQGCLAKNSGRKS